MLRGMSGGGFDGAADADGNAHDVLVVSACPTGKTSSQAQGTSLLNVTLLSPRSLVSAEAHGSRTEATCSTKQCREKDGKTQKEIRRKRLREKARRGKNREEDQEGERKEERIDERGREEKGRRREEQRERKESEEGGSKVVEVETGWVTVKRRTERRRQQGHEEASVKSDG